VRSAHKKYHQADTHTVADGKWQIANGHNGNGLFPKRWDPFHQMTRLCMSMYAPSALYLYSLFAPVGNGFVSVGGEKKVPEGGGGGGG